MFSFLRKLNSCDGKYANSLDVRFTKACDNNCSFCIEKDGIDSLGETDVEKMIESTISSNEKTVLILGGEPFLKVAQLKQYVAGIRPFVEEIYITTSIPKTLTPDNKDVWDILEMIDGLNVSLQHYSPKINNDVLQARHRFNRIAALADILKHERFANKVRVSINLCKGFIDSKEKLEIFFEVMESINCKHVKINELQDVSPELYVSFEKEYGIKMKPPFAFGCQTDITDLINRPFKVTLKRACFKVMHPSIAETQVSVYDVLKLLYRRIKPSQNNMKVLYENGDLSSGWKQKS